MKKAASTIAMVLTVAAMATSLTACGGGGDSNAAGSPADETVTNPTTAQSVSGIAATGAAIAASPIFVLNAAGTVFSGTTGVDGSFRVTVTGSGPFLVYTDTASGRLYGIAPSAGVANVNQITDAIVRAASPSSFLEDGQGNSLVQYINGLGTVPAFETMDGPDGQPGTGDERYRIRDRVNRVAMGCVAKPADGATPAEITAYNAYLDGTDAAMDEQDLVTCIAANSARYQEQVFAGGVDLTWASHATSYVANLSSAKASVINSLGIQNIRTLTGSDAVDLSVVDPMTTAFVAGSSSGFDGLLDRLATERQCDANSGKCATVFTLYQDTAKTTPAAVPQVKIQAASTTVPSYCLRDSELNLLGSTAYRGAAPGEWAVELVTSTISRANGTMIDVAQGNRVCSGSGWMFRYNGGVVSDPQSYSQIAAATTAEQMRQRRPLSCDDFPVGQAPYGVFAYSTGDHPYTPSQFYPSRFGSFGNVVSCTEFSNSAEGNETASGIDVIFAENRVKVTYLATPGN